MKMTKEEMVLSLQKEFAGKTDADGRIATLFNFNNKPLPMEYLTPDEVFQRNESYEADGYHVILRVLLEYKDNSGKEYGEVLYMRVEDRRKE